jgi:hypothetical protein
MRTVLVVTTIHRPTAALRDLAAGCLEHGWDFIVAGDSKSPADFFLEGSRFLSLQEQRSGGFRLGAAAPEKSYTRKNIAYLEAIRSGAEVIVETDDDNIPLHGFWAERRHQVPCRSVSSSSWVNAYRYFTDGFIYPRGLPLDQARIEPPEPAPAALRPCPVQQGLANDDPDVDAVYRMLHPLPFRFEKEASPVLLEKGAWCPFNSQNTTFFSEAFPLLYLPATCSFRMTDIWRSFIATRILEARGIGVLFHGPTVRQERNAHDLHRDFLEEVPGYTHNAEIRSTLRGLSLRSSDSVRTMMETCYGAMIAEGWIAGEEEALLAAWFEDLSRLGTLS